MPKSNARVACASESACDAAGMHYLCKIAGANSPDCPPGLPTCTNIPYGGLGGAFVCGP